MENQAKRTKRRRKDIQNSRPNSVSSTVYSINDFDCLHVNISKRYKTNILNVRNIRFIKNGYDYHKGASEGATLFQRYCIIYQIDTATPYHFT